MMRPNTEHPTKPDDDQFGDKLTERRLTPEQRAFAKVVGQILASRWRRTRPQACTSEGDHSD